MPDSAFEIPDTKPVGRGRPARLAPLKEGLPAEKRVLAEDLRTLFGALGVSVRRYAVRRHHDAGTVTRYLSGDRVPQWDFVAGLIADVHEASAPLTPQAEAALRETHRAALKTNRRNSALQELQDQLAGADEETRRIKTRERALEQALHDRERKLSESVSRSQCLETELDNQQPTHRADVALWEGEYEQLRRDCDDLWEEVIHLQGDLAVTRAELIAAEEQCHQLEVQLDAVAQVEGPVARGCISNGDSAELVLLLKQLHKIDHPTHPRATGVIDHLFAAVTEAWTTEQQATLVISLAQASLTHDADRLARRAASRSGFKGVLRHEQTKYEQKVFSFTFWKKSSLGKQGESDAR
jgi:hypothetical protein